MRLGVGIFLFTALGLAYPPEFVPRFCAPNTLEKMAADAPKAPRAGLMRTHLSANAQFPQMNAGIMLNLIGHYLTQPIRSSELTARPTDAEMESLGEAMNKLHKQCGVGHRTVGHPEAQKPLQEVTTERLRQLIGSFNGAASDRVYQIGNQLKTFRMGGKGAVEWERRMRESSDSLIERPIDDIFKSQETATVADDLTLLGQSIQRFLKTPGLKELQQDYMKMIRANAAPENSNRRDSMTRQTESAMRELFIEFMHQDLPAPLHGQIEGIAQKIF